MPCRAGTQRIRLNRAKGLHPFVAGMRCRAPARGPQCRPSFSATRPWTRSEKGVPRMGPFVDVNVNLSRWPFRRLKGDEPAELVAKLRSQNVVQAWAGSLDG